MSVSKLQIVGQRFGSIVVLARVAGTRNGHALFSYRCDCGTEKTAAGSDLVKSRVMSCGCAKVQRMTQLGLANKRHGYASHKTGRTPTYRTWRAMCQRCDGTLSKGHPSLKYYHDRGITICERWRSFENFLADMGERPEGKTLDRYPNNQGNYEPGNCRWATAQQ